MNISLPPARAVFARKRIKSTGLTPITKDFLCQNITATQDRAIFLKCADPEEYNNSV